MTSINQVAEPIAIVSMGGVFPGSWADSGFDGFWQDIVNAKDLSSEPPDGRWALNLERAYSPTRGGVDRVVSRRACFVAELDFCGLSAEQRRLDPMIHFALRAGREAWAGAQTRRIDRTRVGVVLGNIALPTHSNGQSADWTLGRRFERGLFASHGVESPKEFREPTATINRHVIGLPAAILAQDLGLGGGHQALDAACASSLFAIEIAIRELQAGRLDAVLTGGLARPDCLYTQMGFSQLGALSVRGHCSPFDRSGDGIVVGEGAGVFVLKRLSDALEHGDDVLAVIRGIGVSNDVDGRLLAPSEEGQLRAMRGAYEAAGWSPSAVQLIECHATGTPVGDAVEYRSLRALWGDSAGSAVLGSVKSNVGHLLTGAGAAGLAKVLLAMKHKLLPPTANFSNSAVGIELDSGPFRVLRECEPWESPDGPRRAAVSGFGFGGTNAHLLVEAFEGQEPSTEIRVTVPRANDASVSNSETDDRTVVVVGVGAHLGPWKGMSEVGPRILGFGDDNEGLTTKENFWGEAGPEGFFVESLELEPGRFRIPPKELAQALPQQSMMLDVAEQAVSDCKLLDTKDGRSDLLRLKTGVFIAISLDLNTTNFRLRWAIREAAPRWAKSLGLPESGEAFEAWVTALCDRSGPPLDADRTMGGLGAISASRIAREFGLGGASFVLSSEECSGLVALENAIRALQSGTLDCALVGGVEMGVEPRSYHALASMRAFAPSGPPRPLRTDSDGSVPGEGAVAFVLKRLGDARRDGDRIYARIDGVASASGGRPASSVVRAFAEAGRAGDRPLGPDDLVIAHGSGDPREDRIEATALNAIWGGGGGPETTMNAASGPVISSAIADVGLLGAATGLVGALKAVWSLHHRVLPSLRGRDRGPSASVLRPELSSFRAMAKPRPWLKDRVSGPRRALVGALSGQGHSSHVVFEEAGPAASPPEGVGSAKGSSLPTASHGLFVVEANDERSLASAVEDLAAWSAARSLEPLSVRAAAWLSQGRQGNAALGLAVIASDVDELGKLCALASRGVREGANFEQLAAGRIYYQSEPLCGGRKKVDVAFVYPGSGNQFAGMGRELALAWPEALRTGEHRTASLASQLVPELIWSGPQADLGADMSGLILAQVAIGSLVTDVAAMFGIRPEAAIGYSLGETASLFGLGAWNQRDEMLARVHESSLFTTELAGPCRAAQRCWGRSRRDGHSPEDPVNWVVGVVDRPANAVRAALTDVDRAYLLIVNTPHECVVGGDSDAVALVVERLKSKFYALEGITTVHCEVVGEVEKAYRDLHLLKTVAPEGIRFYSGNWGRAYSVNKERAADSILAQALHGLDFPRVVEQAYEDGVRIFIEMGPGGSCSRMIQKTLGSKTAGGRYWTRALCVSGLDEKLALLRLLAALVAERVQVDLSPLVGRKAPGERPPRRSDARSSRAQKIRVGGAPDWPGEWSPVVPSVRSPLEDTARDRSVFMDRNQCMEYAVGSIEKVLGRRFAAADGFPTRVRLPAEPLMLVDRVVSVTGDALSMGPGSVVTEHDVLADAWYLDGRAIPTCIAVEAGQADLFLSGYLGIDLETRGLAVYRLLDATVTFHDSLPEAGKTIRYAIEIDGFTRQGNSWLFRFRYDATVDGRLLMSMREGCAGFFTQADLDAGKGIVKSSLDLRPIAGKLAEQWRPFVAMEEGQTLNEGEVEALRNGDLVGAFGTAFAGHPLKNVQTIPGGRMRLVHRVTSIEPRGGRFGIGRITAEADIHPDDWFITCHFVDDQVMPGTLMYECCLHTLRIFLMRQGWVGEQGTVRCEPVPGVRSRLKCRGQVLADCRLVTYRIDMKEMGYDADGVPIAVVDAAMFADGKEIVDIGDMSLRMTGVTRSGLESLWSSMKPRAPVGPGRRPALYAKERIVAYCEGAPSEAFGAPYKPFDQKRRIARLPRDPFRFVDRITAVHGEPFVLEAGVSCEAQFDIRADDWFFSANNQDEIPFAVLLEAGLQPCGWLAAYAGSALASPQDLKFRNLGGVATQHARVSAKDDVLSTRVTMTKVSQSAGMIIQDYEIEMWSQKSGLVYSCTTNFGFFSEDALGAQIGLRDAVVAELGDGGSVESSSVPHGAPFPEPMMWMLDRVERHEPKGGTHGLGYIEGSSSVDDGAWFFKAHFYQDPVWPGSLGLEAFLQLLKIVAHRRWHGQRETKMVEFGTMPLGHEHRWQYRGQVLPSRKEVRVQANITAIDDQNRVLIASGLLIADGLPIYQIDDFALELKR